jgi:hypothetical protein
VSSALKFAGLSVLLDRWNFRSARSAYGTGAHLSVEPGGRGG